jgi:hypothetical protein
MSQAARIEPHVPTIPLPNAEPSADVEEIGSVGMLLKSPQHFARLVAQDRFDWQPIAVLLASSFGFFSLYGLSMGVFAGGNALWQAAVKVPLVLMGSGAMCAPALYLALCLSGVSIRPRQVVAMLAGVAGMTSVVLAMSSPVVWLFGAATDGVRFMIMMHLAICGIAAGCGLRLMSHAVPGGFRECRLLYVWAMLLAVVSAQLTTYVRPMLGVAVEKKFREREQKFFFEHFYASMASTKPVDPAESKDKENSPAPIPEADYTPPPQSMAPMSN